MAVNARFIWIVAACLMLLIVGGVLALNSAEGGRAAGDKHSPDSRELPVASGGVEDPASMKPTKTLRKLPEAEAAQTFIERKLRKTIIPVIAFEDTSVEEAIDFLRLRSRELDPEKEPERKGISFVIRKPKVESTDDASLEADSAGVLGAAADPGALRVKELHLRDVSLWDALHRIADECGLKVEVSDTGIKLTPK
jgi:hypothetical protein